MQPSKSPVPSGPAPSAQLLETAETYAGQGKIEEARRLLQPLIADATVPGADPFAADLKARAYNDWGALEWGAGNKVGALKAFTMALLLQPRHPSAHANAASCLEALGSAAEAVDLLKGYTEKCPGEWDARLQMEKLDRRLRGLPERTETVSRLHYRPRPFRVAALVSAYASRRFLRGCLEDLEAQSLAESLQIIVVDTASPDDEASVVEEFQRRYGNLVYVRVSTRETVYWAWNRALQEIEAPLVTNANTDDRHHPRALEILAQRLEDDPGAALAYADCMVTETENVPFGAAPVSGVFRWPDFDRHHLFQVCTVGPQPVWRAELHVRHGFFDASMRSAGDYEFWLRIAAEERFLHVGEALGLYLNNPASLEHRDASLSQRETEAARSRYWNRQDGPQPFPTAGYLFPPGTAALPPGKRRREGPLMTRGPLVSVIVPTRDRPALLMRCLDTLLAQTYADFEIWVVRDGGEPFRENPAARDPRGRIHVIEWETSRGRSAARNAALARSAGALIAYLDDDDGWFPEHLSVMVTALTQSGGGFAYAEAEKREVDSGFRPWPGAQASVPYACDFIPDHFLASNCIATLSVVHARTLYERAGGFDETLDSHEDWELWIRYSRLSHLQHVPRVTGYFTWVRGKDVDPARLREFQRTRLQVFARYRHLAQDPRRVAAFQEKATELFEEEIRRAETHKACSPS